MSLRWSTVMQADFLGESSLLFVLPTTFLCVIQSLLYIRPAFWNLPHMTSAAFSSWASMLLGSDLGFVTDSLEGFSFHSVRTGD